MSASRTARRLLVGAPVLVCVVVAAWFWWRSGEPKGAPGSAPAVAREAPPEGAPDTLLASSVADPTAYASLHASDTDARADLRIVGALLRNYLQSVAGPDAPPLGFNEEIVRALGGANPLQLVFLPAGHPAIDREGRLCDRWGTPYFFHPLSATDIEVRTAGPDRRLFTADDLMAASGSE